MVGASRSTPTLASSTSSPAHPAPAAMTTSADARTAKRSGSRATPSTSSTRRCALGAALAGGRGPERRNQAGSYQTAAQPYARDRLSLVWVPALRPFGDFFARGAKLEALVDDYAVARFEVEAPAIGLAGRQSHWCLPPVTRSYCNSEALSEAA